MERCNISSLLKQELESIDAVILKILDQEATETVIVGSLPQTACIFAINVIFGVSNEEENRYKFVINGQVKSPEIIGLRIRSAGWFPDLSRSVQECEECYGERAFSIHRHEPNSSGREDFSEKDKIEAGIRFFKNFLDGYRDVLDKQFTEKLFFSVSMIGISPEELLEDQLLIPIETRK